MPFFGTLAEIEFDGILTACVFAWEERAIESSRFMLEETKRRLAAAVGSRQAAPVASPAR